MKNLSISLILLFLTCNATQAQDVDLTGRVTGCSGEPIAGAVVTFAAHSLTATTDANGLYQLSNTSGIVGERANKHLVYSGSNQKVLLSLNASLPVPINLHDVNGRLIARLHSVPRRQGQHILTLPRLKTGVFFMTFSEAGNRYVYRLGVTSPQSFTLTPQNNTGFSKNGLPLAKMSPVAETLEITAAGLRDRTVFFENLDSTVDAVLLTEAEFTAGDGYCPLEYIDDVTGLLSLDAGTNDITISHNGRQRRMLLTTPDDYDDERLYPALVAMHGAGGNAGSQSTRWSHQANESDIFVVSLEAVQSEAKWNFKDGFHSTDWDDVGFIEKVINTLLTREKIDPRAVWATGHSSGGLMTWRLARESSLFVAVAPQSCGMARDAHEPLPETKKIPIMQVIGDNDMSYDGNATMYSAVERFDVWREFTETLPDTLVTEVNSEMDVFTWANEDGIELAIVIAYGQEHHLRTDLRDKGDELVLAFLQKHIRR